jgi:hypothetical protein
MEGLSGSAGGAAVLEGLGYVFQSLQTDIVKANINLAANMALRVLGDADTAGVGDTFEPGGDIYTVAEDIVIVDDDVTNVNTDAEFDPRVRRHIGVLVRHATLDFDRATQGVYPAGEFHQHAVACRLDDPPAMLDEDGINEGFSDRLELGQRAFLVGPHQAAIADDIRRQYRCQSPLHALAGQRIPRNCQF